MDRRVETDSMPRLIPTIAHQKEYWDERWTKYANPNEYQTRRGSEIINLLKSLDLIEPRILDIGCGTGWFTAELNKIGESTGIDLSERAIQFAKSQYPHIRYISGNLYEACPDESFDVVVAMEVIPHVEDQLGFVKRIGEILKPGGYLALSMVNKFAIDRSEWDHGPESHIVQWLSMKELKSLLRSNFRILKSKTVIPIGDKGILRVVNSYKVGKLLRIFFSEESTKSFKERIGLGYTRLVLAKKLA